MKSMRQSAGFVILLILTAAAGCAKPPSDAIEAAEQAVKNAREKGANVYVPEEYAKLEGKLTALKQELAEQEGKFAPFQDYGKVEELATSTAQEAAMVASAASQKKEEAKAAALQAQQVAQEAVTSVHDLLARAPVGKDRAAIESIKSDIEALTAALTQIQGSIDREDYQAAQAQAKAIDEKSRAISAEIQDAMAKVKAGKRSLK
ncbi:MAG: hypothetical protein NNA18_05775 [Nitrospira sp.]|nr:hypothetical protein [Nitrospira sp.]